MSIVMHVMGSSVRGFPTTSATTKSGNLKRLVAATSWPPSRPLIDPDLEPVARAAMGKTGSTSETETEAGGHEQSSGTGTTTVERTGSTSETEAGGNKQSNGVTTMEKTGSTD